MTNIKLLKISKPQCVEFQEKHIKANIILVAKYPFKAEGASELSVNKGDILKLLDRPGNGWVLVKSIEKLQTPGLVPASYVDIAVNDTLNPVTLAWIRETDSGSGSSPTDPIGSPYMSSNSFIASGSNSSNMPHSPTGATGSKATHDSSQSALSSNSDMTSATKSFNDAQIQDLITNNRAKTFNNRPYPISASILNFLLYNERYWYRVDVKFSDDSKIYLGRYYQDFYNLHCSLLETSSGSHPNLPKLPEPIPLAKQKDNKELITMLLKRCNDLHLYINKLILAREYQLSAHFYLWLTNEVLPGFTVSKQEMSRFNLKNDTINEKVLPGSIKVLEVDDVRKDELPPMLDQELTTGGGDEAQAIDNSSEESNSASEALSSTADTTPDNSTDSTGIVQRTRSKNVYNHYQQINSFEAFRKHSIKRTGSNASTIVLAGSSQMPSRNPSQGHGPNLAHSHYGHPVPPPGQSNHPQYSPKMMAPLKLNTFEANQPVTPSGSPQLNMQSYTPSPSMNGTASTSGGSTPRKNSISGRRPISRKGSIPSPGSLQTHVQYGGYYNQHHAGQVRGSHPQYGDVAVEYVKCKIVKLNEEIIAIKLDKALIRSIEDFKHLIKQKVFFNKLLIKLPNFDDFRNIDDIKLDIVLFMKVNDKAWLKTV